MKRTTLGLGLSEEPSLGGGLQCLGVAFPGGIRDVSQLPLEMCRFGPRVSSSGPESNRQDEPKAFGCGCREASNQDSETSPGRPAFAYNCSGCPAHFIVKVPLGLNCA